MILLIDNYDSFVYNLYQMMGSITKDICVIRNDACTLTEIIALQPSHIVISPGPGKPSDAGICEAVIAHFHGKVPILGVCLGHQAICECFGGTITYAKTLFHGKQSVIDIKNEHPLFAGLPKQIQVGRYHSLALQKDTLPKEFMILGETAQEEVMAIAHQREALYGVQFHPESILTPLGKQILENFLH